MKLLLIAVVICIHTSRHLTRAQVKCQPRYNGGHGGPGGASVQLKWTFNPQRNYCEAVMVKVRCRLSANCFQTRNDCEDYCDPKMQQWKQLLN
uniref:Putative secreted protein n=1 Tax=Ixodes ricinus TaxID=34613 RepID=V5GPC6_IXORI